MAKDKVYSKTVWVIRHASKGRWIKFGPGNTLNVTTNPMAAYEYFSQEQAWQDLQGLRDQDPKKFADWKVDNRTATVTVRNF